ncbi:MAG: hypothetical protein K6F46_10640 [Desulfovibrio sp.]|nr:hypothetical protein [Desulfovibrio sp.]
MELFLLALLVMAAGALVSAAIALFPVTAARNKVADILGPVTAVAACLLGLAGIFSGEWAATEYRVMPWGLPFGAFALALDSLTRLFLLPVFVLGGTCALSGGISLRQSDPTEHNLGAHWLFFLILLLGMTLVMSARDAVLFMLSWELMSLSPFFLIDFNDRDRSVQDASWVYLVAAHLGAMALIAFFALLWQESGSTLFSEMALARHGHVTALFMLALLGFGAKAGLVPLHVWLPEAHPAAPSHVSALLSGAMLNAGVYGIIRSFDFFGNPQTFPLWWGWIVTAVGIATAVTGILKALGQTNLKRLLAYSSVENMGVILLGLGAGLIGAGRGEAWMTALGFSGCLFHMLNHSAFKGLLFLCAGEVLHSTGTVNMSQLGGLQRRMPFLGTLFALGAASIACMPPFNGFMGEFVLSLSLIGGLSLPGMEEKIGVLVCMTGLMLVSGLSAAVYIKSYSMTFLGEARSQCSVEPHTTSPVFQLPLLIPAAACVIGGLGAQWAFGMVEQAMTCIPTLPDSLKTVSIAADENAGALLGKTALFCTGGLVLLVSFTVLRRLLLLRQGIRRGPTWGCGYQYGSARMQYSPASFVEPAARLFASVMGTTMRRHEDAAYFPGHDSLSVKAPDVVQTKFYTPVFEWMRRLCNSLKIIQNGAVNIYVLYILITLVVLLVWGMA